MTWRVESESRLFKESSYHGEQKTKEKDRKMRGNYIYIKRDELTELEPPATEYSVFGYLSMTPTSDWKF